MAANDRDRERNRRASDAPAGARPGTPRVQNPPADPVVVGRRPIVTQRRRSPITWLLPLLLLLALIPLLRRDRGAEDDQLATRNDTLAGTTSGVAGGDVTNAGAVARFGSWANQSSGATAAEPQVSHVYVAEGIRYLADALQEITLRPGGTSTAAGTTAAGGAGAGRAGGTSYADRIQSIRDRASQIEQASPNDNQAQHANAAFTEAARLISELRGGQITGTRGSGDLMNAARAVRSGQALSEQGEQVRTFFQRAATALRGLSGGTGPGTTGMGAGSRTGTNTGTSAGATGTDTARRR